MFQTNHGYSRHYRPPYRVPYHQQYQPRGYPNVNNYCERKFQYPPQRVRGDNMGYYRPPVYHTGPRYARYTKQVWKDWSTDTQLPYRYDGGNTLNTAMQQYSNAKNNIAQTSNAQRQLSTAPVSTAQSTTMPQTVVAQPSQPLTPEISMAQPSRRQTKIAQPLIAQVRMEQNSVTQQPPSTARMKQSQNSVMQQLSMTRTSMATMPQLVHVSLFQPTMQNTSTVSAAQNEGSISQPSSISSPIKEKASMPQPQNSTSVTHSHTAKTSTVQSGMIPPSQTSVVSSSIPRMNQMATIQANLSQSPMEVCSLSQLKSRSLAPSSVTMTHGTPRPSTKQQQTSVSQQPSNSMVQSAVMVNKTVSRRMCDPRLTKMSQPTMKQMSVTKAQMTHAEQTMTQPTNTKSLKSQSSSITSKSPSGKLELNGRSPLLVFLSALHCGLSGFTHIQGNRFDENNEQYGKNVVVCHYTLNHSFF
jgi:hypothetical protein